MTVETSAILAHNIQRIRESKGLNRNRCAVGAGVGFNTWKGWELQWHSPRTHHLPNIARVLECSVADLFVNDEPPRVKCDCGQWVEDPGLGGKCPKCGRIRVEFDPPLTAD